MGGDILTTALLEWGVTMPTPVPTTADAATALPETPQLAPGLPDLPLHPPSPAGLSIKWYPIDMPNTKVPTTYSQSVRAKSKPRPRVICHAMYV